MGYDRFKAARKRRNLRLEALNYKGNCCSICGYDGRNCPSAVDFHHVDDFEKEFNISAKMTNFAAIRLELDKCVLLCARCHREVHDGLHPGYLASDENDYEHDYDEAE